MVSPKIKKSDYLTIPEAPNYEVNGFLKVRNKKTGNILKGENRPPRKVVVVVIQTPNGILRRSTAVLYRNARAQFEKDVWNTIPSLDCKYEINIDGDVRNCQTKKVIKLQVRDGSRYYILRYRGQYVNRLQCSLMNEVYHYRICKKRRPIKVQLHKDGKHFHFDSIAACARFLAPKVFYSVNQIREILRKNPQDFFGWSVKCLAGRLNGSKNFKEATPVAKEDFLLIPDAPNYEVNSDYVVRNVSTGRVRKPNSHGTVLLECNGSRFSCNGETYYRRATAALDNDWKPVPSLNGKYELSSTGSFRNVKTKRVLKPQWRCYRAYFTVVVENRMVWVPLDRLLAEVYDIRREPPPKILISQGGVRIPFATFSDCAEFLAQHAQCLASTLRNKLTSRPGSLLGWAVHYF